MAVNPARFRGGSTGEWRIVSQTAVTGEALAEARFLAIRPSLDGPDPGLDGWSQGPWVLRGTNSHVRYSERAEVNALDERRAVLGRPGSTRAALIPIRKSPEWWAMAQDERRRVMEADSHHIAQSIAYLPAIARRLYHCRDLIEPFDFLTWFEFAPENEFLFDQLVAALRSTPEWGYVDREVDIRLERV